jgi:hypothetical protein
VLAVDVFVELVDEPPPPPPMIGAVDVATLGARVNTIGVVVPVYSAVVAPTFKTTLTVDTMFIVPDANRVGAKS